MKLLVRNLSRKTTEKELRAYFIVFGRVQSCNLVLDKETGQSKGFAFVEMPKAGEAKVAIKKLNNQVIGGNKIRVKKAESRPTMQTTSQSDEPPLEQADEAPSKEADDKVVVDAASVWKNLKNK